MQTNKQTIFIIDDEPAVCDSLQWLFESIQFQVETYRTASSFQQNYDPKNAGLLITDVRLPDISGLQLLEKLKQQKIFLPVIVITGYGDIPMAVRAMKLGAKDFLLKTFNEQFLLEKVQKHINQSVNNESLHILNKRINSLSKREIGRANV